MGFDVSSNQLFIGNKDALRAQVETLEALRIIMQRAGWKEAPIEEDEGRSFVVVPHGRWLHVGDSTGSTETSDSSAFDEVSRQLSIQRPVVDLLLSDSAAVHFRLYREGSRIDQFGNMNFPFFLFKTEEEAAPFRGIPELWSDLLSDRASVSALRNAWVQSRDALQIIDETAQCMGWNRELLDVGYSHDDEGIWIKYDEYLGPSFDLTRFQELHFNRSAP